MAPTKKQEIKKIVLAYSGGLDTSIILKWLKNEYGCKVVAFSADLGQGEELDPVREKALATGADKVYIDDLKEEFVRDFVFPMFRANAIYEGHYHFDPSIKVIAPWRMWDLNSRQALIDYAKKNDIPIPTIKKRPWSSDRNLLHISFEGGILEDTWAEAPEEMYVLTKSPEKAPNKPQYVEIEFKNGNAVAVDGEKMTPAQLLAHLNFLGGQHGVGRVDLLENRSVGMKSRGVYETPGGTILREAHSAVEQITMDREVMRIRDSLIPEYAKQIYAGYWFSPERQMLQTLIDDSQKCVNGVARVKLYKGLCRTVGRKSETDSLFNLDFATFEKDQVFNQADAEGFIKINSLRLRIRSLMQANRKK